jgi:Icc-related predicted phosphoesterase
VRFRKQQAGQTAAGASRRLRIYYCADLHGSERCFRKFVRAGRFYGVDLLMLGGDVSGKILIPVLRRPGGGWEATLLDQHYLLETEQELRGLEEKIRFNGFYPYLCSAAELDELAADPQRVTASFREQMLATTGRWMEMAEAELSDGGLECIIMPGNDDEWELDEVLSSGQRVINGDRRVVDIGGYQVLSLGVSNPTPWHSPREMDETELEATLREVGAGLDQGRPVVINVHCPPHRSKLDEAPALTSDLQLVSAAGERPTVPVGSTAVRTVLAEWQPVLSVHGHIHESRAAGKVGRTMVVNPGSRYNEGALLGTIIELAGDQVRRQQFVTG